MNELCIRCGKLTPYRSLAFVKFRGQEKYPSSTLFVKRRNPSPSQIRPLILLARLPQKRNRVLGWNRERWYLLSIIALRKVFGVLSHEMVYDYKVLIIEGLRKKTWRKKEDGQITTLQRTFQWNFFRMYIVKGMLDYVLENV